MTNNITAIIGRMDLDNDVEVRIISNDKILYSTTVKIKDELPIINANITHFDINNLENGIELTVILSPNSPPMNALTLKKNLYSYKYVKKQIKLSKSVQEYIYKEAALLMLR
jgi:hypothetical protein